MPSKRKLSSSFKSSAQSASKKRQTTLDVGIAAPKMKPVKKEPTEEKSTSPVLPDEATTPADHYDVLIVNRKYYPPVISTENAEAYISGDLPNPLARLTRTLKDAASFRSKVVRGRSVVCWFRTDLRWDDNTALATASALAQGEVHVIGMFLFSPQDLEAHLLSPARIDFMLRSLKILRDELEKKGIPVYCETVEKRRRISERVLELAEEWGARHVYANVEYEVDELRRDEKCVTLGVERGIAVDVFHDTCVVPPAALATKSTSKPFTVYSPWFKAWKKFVLDNPDHCTTLRPSPRDNPASARTDFPHLFTSPLPTAPATKTLDSALKKRLHSLFPAGQTAAHTCLQTFIKNRITTYDDNRNTPSISGTSSLSPHLCSGTISARTCLSAALTANSSRLETGSTGITTWISEVAWRDFYRHVLAAYPHICMNKPFKPLYHNIIWASPSLSAQRLDLWKNGQTGFPIIDAAMRHLKAHCWLPNRMRMVVASFLAKDLHVDWRLGEQYFMENLIDGDFASNSGGWGFASSTGVDPQPYFRVFNPVRQSETWDKEGVYVREWVQELKGVEGKEVHEPSDRLRRKVGYPRMCVEHDGQRKGAVEMYKAAIEMGKI